MTGASAAALVSGTGWLAFVAIAMSGLSPLRALQGSALHLVWSQTHFGRLWQLRALFWLAASASLMLHLKIPSRSADVSSRDGQASPLLWAGGIFACGLVASLAWAGHGQTGPWPSVHLGCDVLHLLISAIWPAGLLPFAVLLMHLRAQHSPDRETIHTLTRRFSAVSLIGVALLACSGVVSSWPLVGAIENLWLTNYGRVLLLKLCLVALMIWLRRGTSSAGNQDWRLTRGGIPTGPPPCSSETCWPSSCWDRWSS